MAIPASISEFLDRHRARYSVLTHPVAYTAQEEAAAAQVPGHEWAKVVVCIADDRPVLAVIPAPLKVDFERLRNVTHAHSLRLAHEDEFKGLYTDCEIGAMPPLGPLYRQDVVVDETLAAHGEIVFEQDLIMSRSACPMRSSSAWFGQQSPHSRWACAAFDPESRTAHFPTPSAELE